MKDNPVLPDYLADPFCFRLVALDPSAFPERDGVVLAVNPPRREAVFMPPHAPWEIHRGLYCSVIQDGGEVRLWYAARSEPGDGHGKHLCYATSSDGIHFTCPELDIHPWHDGRPTNLVYFHSLECGIFIDPLAPPESRYCGTWSCFGKGLFLFTSSDGLHWTRAAEPLLRFECDSQNTAHYDPRRKAYVGYVRAWIDGSNRDRRRLVARWEAPTIERPFDVTPLKVHPNPNRLAHLTTELPIVMACDEFDPPETDVYTNAVIPHPDIPGWHLAFPTLYRHLPEPESGAYRNAGTCESQFMASADGIAWLRYDRGTYAAPGPGENMCYVGQGMIQRGDEWWQYATVHRRLHGPPPEGRTISEDGEIARFVQLRDRFVTARFDAAGGRVMSRPVVWRGTLRLNADCGGRGELRVAVCNPCGSPLPGYDFAACEPVRGNGLRLPVAWPGAEPIAPGRSVVLRIVGDRASLFAAASLDSESSAPSMHV